MNNKNLSWYKEINNNFIITSRAYFLQLLTRHYDQRPFDETVCGALITNGGVENTSKKVQNVCDGGCIKHVQILVACAMQGIWFSSINCLQWGGTKETGSQVKVCAIHSIRFTRMNCLWLGNTKKWSARSRCVCDIQHAVHADELFVLRQENRNGSI